MPAGGERLRGSPRPTAGTADLQLTWEGVSREYRSRELSAPLEYVRTHSARSGEQREQTGGSPRASPRSCLPESPTSSVRVRHLYNFQVKKERLVITQSPFLLCLEGPF